MEMVCNVLSSAMEESTHNVKKAHPPVAKCQLKPAGPSMAEQSMYQLVCINSQKQVPEKYHIHHCYIVYWVKLCFIIFKKYVHLW